MSSTSTPVEDPPVQEPTPTDARTRPRGGGRRWWVAAGVVGAVAVTAGVVAATSGGASDGDEAQAASASTATTKIVRQDLLEQETVDGTLGYSDARAVINRLAGTVTWTPRIGTVVETNHRLYAIDGQAVYLLDGAYPAYRTLEAGLEGDDVLALERNLRHLGLDEDHDMTVDGTWDWGTTEAVKRWQERKGLQETGSIEQGRIVFQPGDRRVSSIDLAVGQSASGGGGGGSAAAGSASASSGDVSSTLMTTTSTKRIVAVDLEATKQSLAQQGEEVTVDFPDGKRADGRIATVGKVAQKKATASDDDPPATIKLVIKLTKSVGTGLDQAPVDVRLTKSRARDVLTVPVTALIAQQGGDFAVEVRDGGTRRVVPVETGLYTDSDVEIKGDGLTAGMSVTNARI